MTAAEELEKLYEAAERKLVEIIARKASAGSAVAYERQILKQVSAELKKLRRATPELVRQMVLSGYRTGLEGAVEDILKVDPSLPRSYNLFSRVNTRQIDLIVQNTADSLTKATRIVGRRIEDEIRAAGLRASALKEATGGTVGDMQKDLEKRLLGLDLRQANGKIGVRYKNGKVVSLKDYSKMVARTTTAEAQNKAKIVQAEEWGYDLAECTTHAPTCEVCAMYQGRAYALTKEAANGKYKGPGGEPLRFPYLYDTALVHGYETIHPNCRHRFIIKPPRAYTKAELEKLSRHSMQPFRDTRSDAERKAYAKEQAVNRARNADRREWETYRRALPDEAYARFSDFRRAKQANSQRYQELKKSYRNLQYMQEVNLEPLPITAKSIAGVKKFSCELLSPVLQTKLQNEHKKLLISVSGKPDGTEAGATYDLTMNLLHKVVGTDSAAKVAIPKEPAPYIAIHTHPSGGTFTHTDLRLFAKDDNMKMLTAVGNNGIVYAVEKTAGFSSVKFNAYRKSVLDRHLNYLDSPVYYSKYIKDLLKGIEAYGIRYYATGT